MSNKKLFGIVFLILSYCEFGNFAYSKASLPNVPLGNNSNKSSIGNEDKNLDNKIVFNGKSTRYFCPDKNVKLAYF